MLKFDRLACTVLKLQEGSQIIEAMKSLTAADNGDSESVSMPKLSLLIDLYHFMPFYRKLDKNISSDLY